MNAYRGVGAPHPHFVSIPDPEQTEGVRAYREPTVPHPLQITFLEAENEYAWTEEMRSLLSSGRSAEADARLSAELAGFDGALARLCKATTAADAVLEGWDDLLPIIAEWEGPPVTAITLGFTNPPDLVFEPGRIEEPELLLSLYSDEAYPFSRAANSELLAECEKELPGWLGQEEDVEFYCSLSGLGPLNTALIHSKHRYFLRDGRDGVEGRAPGGYVEFVLGSWLLATRFLQAVERAVSDHGLPLGCRLISGAVGVNADFVAVLGSDKPRDFSSTASTAAPQAQFATLSMKPWVPREDPTADALPASTLRQRLRSSEPESAAAPRRGFLARLFHRPQR
ncbi:MAG TPA: hypothetical protein VGD10_04575 [Allosphingosinicella sp.]|uniref:hypothetical protein n=1 Tax=Allosphingosinicella sp. TaxID=2823234 RepID=UPI002ED81D3F